MSTLVARSRTTILVVGAAVVAWAWVAVSSASAPGLTEPDGLPLDGDGAVNRIGTREEWLAARISLLAEEKKLTRRSDELHGLSAFGIEDGVVYHTYSCYDRGTDVLSAPGSCSTALRRGAVTTQRAGRADTTSTRLIERSL